MMVYLEVDDEKRTEVSRAFTSLETKSGEVRPTRKTTVHYVIKI
jgi:hypothetical protein